MSDPDIVLFLVLQFNIFALVTDKFAELLSVFKMKDHVWDGDSIVSDLVWFEF